jgi:predicted PurR-regulated permease PerM
VWLGLRVIIAAAIVQQILENLIAPRIIGSVTGLNPLWVFLSILTGAKIGGLLGVVVAVPTAAVIKTALIAIRSRITHSGIPPATGGDDEMGAEASLPTEAELSQVSRV